MPISGYELLIRENGLHNSTKRFTYGFFLNFHVQSGFSYFRNTRISEIDLQSVTAYFIQVSHITTSYLIHVPHRITAYFIQTPHSITAYPIQVPHIISVYLIQPPHIITETLYVDHTV